jgi:hypothetical protein
MKLTLVFVAVLLVLSSFSSFNHGSKKKSTSSTDLLEWNSDYKLDWADFKGTANAYSDGDAATAIQIKAQPYYYKKTLYYNVEAYFIRHKSWSKNTSAALLAHEQLHFDIAELYARKVRKKISEYKQMGVKDVQDYNDAIRKILNESNGADLQYDQETVHGAISRKQAQWQKNVKEELNLLRNYENVLWKARMY